VPEVGLEPTRGCPHRILSPLRSPTRVDTEGQEETELRFYRGFGASEGTGRDREGYPVAVRLRSKPGIQLRALEPEAAKGYDEKASSRRLGE
jgi:hypothetical protein